MTPEMTSQDITFSKATDQIKEKTVNLIRNEGGLIAREIGGLLRALKTNIAMMLVFSSLFLGGCLSLLAFAILGIGALLKTPYWASSLIVGIVLAGGGAWLTIYFFKRAKDEDFSLPHSRKALNLDV